jgi:hypothetical protein
MNNSYGMMKQLAKLGLLLMLAVSLSACSTNWREEVLLHDGSKIIVSRSVERGGLHEIRQSPPIKEQSLSFVLPSIDQRITWKDNYSEDIGAASFLPMQLEIFNGTPYIVASPMGCLSYNKWGRPNPPYVIFKHDGKEWQRIQLQELPAESKTPNLIISSPDSEAKQIPQSPISAETIKELNTGFRQPENQTILREPLPQERINQMCMEMVPYKGSWVMPNDRAARGFIDQQKK